MASQTEDESFWDKYNPLTGSYRKKKPLSVQMAETGLDVVTPIGTIKDIQDELDKKDPSYALIAGMASLELLGPVAGTIKMAAKAGDKGLLEKILGSFKSKPASQLKDKGDLGFNEDVYHYTTSETIEGDKFNPDKAIGNWNRLGVHVGGQKASNDRFTGINDPKRYPEDVQGSTLPLKARINKPLMFGDEIESEYSVQSNLRKMAEDRGLDPTNFAADLRKQLAEEGYTHIPYINEVEAEGTISYIMLVDRPEGSDAVVRSKFAEFDPSKKDKPELGLAEGGEVKYWNGAEEIDGLYSPEKIIQYAAQKPRQFAQGGLTMNEQTQMAFMQQGGLKDDGMNKDPVSGNSVPNGSMANEVRDDIPAQLSEGEYVVPADVVRYYGVKHFEDIRNKAKSGLQSMEANGRIGGEPVPVGGPKAAPMQQPPTPYNTVPTQPQQQMSGGLNQGEMNEIQSMMMAVGGFVEEPNNMQQGNTDPYQQQQTMYKQPMAMGAANGTDVSGLGFTPSSTEAFVSTPSSQAGDASFSTKPITAIVDKTVKTSVTLYSPDGLIVKILNLPDQQMEYNNLIAQGYVTTKPTVAQKSSGGRRGGSGGTPGGSSPIVDKDWGEDVDWTKPGEYADKIYNSVKDLNNMAGAGFAGASAFGAPGIGVALAVGAKFKIGTAVSDLHAAAIIAEARGLPNEVKRINAMADNLIKSGGGLLQFANYLGMMSGEEKATNRLDELGYQYGKDDDGSPIFNSAQTKYNLNLGSTSTSTGTADSTFIRDADRKERSFKGIKGGTSKQIAEENKKAKSKALASGATEEKATQAGDIAGGQMAGKGYVGGTGFNKGGLMTSKKKKKKTKGK